MDFPDKPEKRSHVFVIAAAFKEPYTITNKPMGVLLNASNYVRGALGSLHTFLITNAGGPA